LNIVQSHYPCLIQAQLWRILKTVETRLDGKVLWMTDEIKVAFTSSSTGQWKCKNSKGVK